MHCVSGRPNLVGERPVEPCAGRFPLPSGRLSCFCTSPTDPLHPPPAQIECGPDATAILSTTGQLYACGNNEYNKLCLNRTGSILSRRRSSSDKHDSSDSYDSLNHSQGAEELGTRRGEIRISTIFQPARATQARRTFAKVRAAGRLLLRVGVPRLEADTTGSRFLCSMPFVVLSPLWCQVAIGLEHIALLDHDGNIIVSGNNSSGQLGCGALRPSRGTHIVRGTLSGIPVGASRPEERRVFARPCRHWGRGLGHGVTSSSCPPPQLADVACGDYFTLATTKTGQLYGWGSVRALYKEGSLLSCRRTADKMSAVSRQNTTGLAPPTRSALCFLGSWRTTALWPPWPAAAPSLWFLRRRCVLDKGSEKEHCSSFYANTRFVFHNQILSQQRLVSRGEVGGAVACASLP